MADYELITNLVTVVIPIYKENLSDNEALSFEQCCKVLGRYEISLVFPSGLCLREYEYYLDKYQVFFNKYSFDPIYFAGVEGYNKLLLSVDFYLSFVNYQYILIYQLDAFVFRDELEYWCSKGYDYIGAPWFKRIWRFKYSKNLRAIGNGGFSLRKVQSCINVLKYNGKFKPLRYFFTFHNAVFLKLKKMPLKNWRSLKIENSVDFFVSINRKTEDQFWSLDTQNAYIDFKVAPIREGIKFAFECYPSYLMKLNSGNLPFGCHAWERYELEFWKKYIG